MAAASAPAGDTLRGIRDILARIESHLARPRVALPSGGCGIMMAPV